MEKISSIIQTALEPNTQMPDFDEPKELSDDKRIEASENWADYMLKFGVPENLLRCRLENYNAKNDSQIIAKEYLLSMPGRFRFLILLWGCAGVGKTHLACSVIYKYILSRIRSRFVVSVDLFSDLRRAFSDNEAEYYIMKKYKMPEILVIDDMGTEKSTDYVRQTWYDIIDYRYRNRYPTLVTTNLSLDMIAHKFDDRVSSRLASGKVLHITGDDYRLSF